jgi:KDO2-lipid IV(A) lauroyltransferase
MPLPVRADATAWSYRAGWAVAGRLPDTWLRRGLLVAADAAWARRGAGVRTLEDNLRRAVDGETDLRQLSRAAMRSYLRYWGEAFTLPRWSPDEVRARVVAHQAERLRDPLAAGRGVVAVLPHMGNWDLAGAWACAEGMAVTTVAERLRPESLYRDFVGYRESLGMEVLPLTGGPPVAPLLERRLRAGRLICLLADRELAGRGVRVPFLGDTARFPPGPAWLARTTGAVLLPVSTSYEDDRMHLWVHPPIEVGQGALGMVAATEAVAAAFGSAIRRDPADWHMLQPVFAADPAGRC